MSTQGSFSLRGRNPDVLTCIANSPGLCPSFSDSLALQMA